MSDAGTVIPDSNPVPRPESAASEVPGVQAKIDGGGPAQVIQGIANAGVANYINQQNVHNLRVVSRYVEDETFLIERPFSTEDAKPFTEKLSAELLQTFVGDAAMMTRLLRQLEECRVLLITGERDVGKRTAALYLGVQMARQRGSGPAPLLVDSLERRIELKLCDIAADVPGFGGRTTVFADVFEQRNTQLRAFFASADHVGWEQLTELLRKNGAYFIFTATTETVPTRQQSTDRLAHCEMAPPGGAWIEQGIDKRLEWMSSVEDSARERLAILAEHRARIVAELKTLSRGVAFIRHFIREDSDFESSLRRFRDASYWFRTALEEDAEAWTFAFALTLAQPTRDADAAPWADFERLRRALSARLRSDPELGSRHRAARSNEIEGARRSLVDDSLLERCRAFIAKDSNRLGDTVCFDHPTVTAQLWETILQRYRRVLMAVLPALRALAEKGSNDWSVRVMAAQVIGRIGEIDPDRITLPVIHRWAVSGDQALRRLVGRLVQGALGSGNETYRKAAIRHVELLADSRAMGADEEASDSLLTAVSAYAQIGVYEPADAMEHLGTIVIEHLAPIFEDIHKSARAVDMVDTQLAQTKSNRVAELHRRRLQLSAFATDVFAEYAPVLIAVGQIVSFLCRMNDPIQTLRRMRDWIARGGPSTGVLVSLLFLRGIAADLQASLSGARSGKGSAGALLLSLAMSKDAVHHFCSFLADVHASFNSTFTLPASLQRDFQEQFAECLTVWAREGIAYGDHRQSVQDLFVALGTARRGVIRQDLLAALDGAAFSATDSMKTFAGQVRARLNAALHQSSGGKRSA